MRRKLIRIICSFVRRQIVFVFTNELFICIPLCQHRLLVNSWSRLELIIVTAVAVYAVINENNSEVQLLIALFMATPVTFTTTSTKFIYRTLNCRFPIAALKNRVQLISTSRTININDVKPRLWDKIAETIHKVHTKHCEHVENFSFQYYH